MAASTASPPLCSTAMPAWDARGWPAHTIPFPPLPTGRCASKLLPCGESAVAIEGIAEVFLTMQRHESKDLRSIEDLIHRDQIMIGVLKTNVPRTVIDRLNLAKVEEAGIVSRSGEAIGGLLP